MSYIFHMNVRVKMKMERVLPLCVVAIVTVSPFFQYGYQAAIFLAVAEDPRFSHQTYFFPQAWMSTPWQPPRLIV